MAASRFTSDSGLTRRMLFTMLLVALVYVAAALPAFRLGPGWGLAAVAALVAAAVALCRSMDRFVLWVTGARVVDAAEEPELHAIVEMLCMTCDLPKPRVAVLDLDVPNAFAAGSGPGTAVLCVTEGLRRRLEPAELAAVLAHEAAHVVNRDVLITAVAAFPAMCAGTLLSWWAAPRGAAGLLARVVLAPVAAAAFVLYCLGTVTGMALSRHRELCADATGSLCTGRPGDLAAALARIGAAAGDATPADRRALRPVSALCVVPARLLSTHPAMDRRQARLTMLSQRLAAGT
ncbi:M48 family metalloprotease [Actinomadura macrotermitis]|uniref:Protease HtpX n=1 Tax=Actinomadura macrotermitis TaxID=2585200 RepID=A0A7K0BMV5_9ACTN|nr:M48 family metalloprotease [Actinomadura macrotermitis]MQY02509.1 Protease HtpX [Actinomadura macrotermitis]